MKLQIAELYRFDIWINEMTKWMHKKETFAPLKYGFYFNHVRFHFHFQLWATCRYIHIYWVALHSQLQPWGKPSDSLEQTTHVHTFTVTRCKNLLCAFITWYVDLKTCMNSMLKMEDVCQLSVLRKLISLAFLMHSNGMKQVQQKFSNLQQVPIKKIIICHFLLMTHKLYQRVHDSPESRRSNGETSVTSFGCYATQRPTTAHELSPQY